jgi:hypothetical protein
MSKELMARADAGYGDIFGYSTLERNVKKVNKSSDREDGGIDDTVRDRPLHRPRIRRIWSGTTPNYSAERLQL